MKFAILISASFLVLLSSCQKDHMLDCFKSTGKTITESRPSSAFVNIRLEDNVDLVINPNQQPYIKVTAGENLIDGIITEIDGNTLYIRNENRCNWMRSFDNKYIVEIGIDKPEKIYYNGTGNIHCLDTIRSHEFTLDCFGGSGTLKFLFDCHKTNLYNHIGRTDVHAAGFNRESDIFLNDVGIIELPELVISKAYIRHSSTGKCIVNVADELGYEIRYNGNIYYKGNPAFTTQQISGTGKLLRY